MPIRFQPRPPWRSIPQGFAELGNPRAKSTTLLTVLDGFGHRQAAPDNAIAQARAPNWGRFLATRPHALISSSGADVGLPEGQMGNSEVGHMHLGAGRIVHQDLTRIDRAIEKGELGRNPALNGLFARLAETGGALHVLGLLSPGGVHSHENHIFDLLRAAKGKGVGRMHLHAFLDGRDTPPRSARPSLEKAQALLAELGSGSIASICGRYYAMDRDQRWERTARAWQLIAAGAAPFRAASALAALGLAYERGETDEFVQPSLVQAESPSPSGLTEADALIFMNFRADRARQLARALADPGFASFPRPCFAPPASFVTLCRYADDIDLPCAFAPLALRNTLGEHLAGLGLAQLRIAETEKYAHVTYFFSGGRERPFAGEERILIPSPKVATYDLQPEMSAAELTDELIAAILSRRFDFIVCNYANGDMVGHTGVFQAAVRAVETLDLCLGRVEAALAQVGGQMLLTSDHGNVEQMRNAETDQPHTAHTSERVPLVYIGPRKIGLAEGGTLADLAPSLLELMDLEAPPEMTGRSLIRLPREAG